MLLIVSTNALAQSFVPKLILTDHALADKIWSTKDKRIVDKTQLVPMVLQSDYILLGETHDNSAHHQYQTWVIDTLSKNKKDTAVAFEMINASQGEKIAGIPKLTTDTLISVLNEIPTGWEYELFYRPLFESTLNAGFAIYPANLDRQKIVDIVVKGEQFIPPDIKQLLDKEKVTTAYIAAMRKEIDESHCHMIDNDMIDGMISGQRVRDVTMSISMVKNRHSRTIVLIAGSGHVRNDRGVPYYIRQQDSNARILSIAGMEVEEGVTDVSQYAQQWDQDNFPFDFVWFTPRGERPDPCESLKNHSHKNKSTSNGQPSTN